MVVFGRETQAKQERVERFRAWVSARSPLAVISFMLGLVAVVDFFTSCRRRRDLMLLVWSRFMALSLKTFWVSWQM